MSPTKWETAEPAATRPGGTPVMRAKSARERSVASHHGSHPVHPPRQSSSACWRASQAGWGGSP